MKNTYNSPLIEKQAKNTKKDYAKLLYSALYRKPISRRMAATIIGFPHQTYMVTQLIYDWIEAGKAQVVGRIKCSCSSKFVEAVTTNPEYFIAKNDNQLKLF
jgi:hypothetical protein